LRLTEVGVAAQARVAVVVVAAAHRATHVAATLHPHRAVDVVTAGHHADPEIGAAAGGIAVIVGPTLTRSARHGRVAEVERAVLVASALASWSLLTLTFAFTFAFAFALTFTFTFTFALSLAFTFALTLTFTFAFALAPNPTVAGWAGRAKRQQHTDDHADPVSLHLPPHKRRSSPRAHSATLGALSQRIDRRSMTR
jgi:hypothetical protein